MKDSALGLESLSPCDLVQSVKLEGRPADDDLTSRP